MATCQERKCSTGSAPLASASETARFPTARAATNTHMGTCRGMGIATVREGVAEANEACRNAILIRNVNEERTVCSVCGF
jgi:hypothetical protein